MSLIGYARVSTLDQDPNLQLDALTTAGCERIFTDEGTSGAIRDRPQLNTALDYLRPGDTLVVWRLDRLGRSLSHLISLIEGLGQRGIEFRSLTEDIDTQTPGGRLVFHVLGAITQFERDLIRERTMAGLAAARVRGRVGGRRPVLTEAKLRLARMMLDRGSAVTDVAAALGVARSTIYRALQRDNGTLKSGTGAGDAPQSTGGDRVQHRSQTSDHRR